MFHDDTIEHAACCRLCLHYHEHTTGSGDCHRYPPSFAGDGTPNEKHRWRHPLVQQHNWCGEFMPPAEP